MEDEESKGMKGIMIETSKRKNRLVLNTVTSLSLQIVTVICGFILPRLILIQYGTGINGLVQSISQFLSIISFLELGVGAVIQSAMYRPLADNDKDVIEQVVIGGEKFFKKIAYILVGYTFVLIFIFPLFNSVSYSRDYIATLIIAISISSFSQYYFGLIDNILLVSSQKGYIVYISQIITIILNTLMCSILIKAGASIQVVKLSTSLIYVLRPICIRIYVNKNFDLNRHRKLTTDPIKQKWDGVSQHISHIVLENTDIIVLTVFSSIANVSIYSVYYMVISGIKNLYVSITHGFQSLFGELWAKKDKDGLDFLFSFSEWLLHSGVVFLFSCVGILIVPFVEVYTAGVSDADYFQPLFAVLLTIANAVHCLRIPHHMLIKAAGEYKETQKCFIYSALINIVISIAVVRFFGLIGVAIGTAIAMLFQTVWMALYCSKHITKRPIHFFVKQIIFDFIAVCIIVVSTCWIKINTLSYLSWAVMAIKVALIAAGIVAAMSLLFYRKQLLYLLKNIKK